MPTRSIGTKSRMPTRSMASMRRRESTDLEPLMKNWWMFAARGILAVLFGCVLAAWRAPVLEALLLSFAIYAVVDGVLAIASVFRAAVPRMAGWPILFEGIASVGLGGLAVSWPRVPGSVFAVLAAGGLLTGILEIVGARRLPRNSAGHWLFATGGISSLFLGVLVLALRHAASDAVTIGVATYAIVFGFAVLGAALAFRSAVRFETPVGRLTTTAR